MKKKLTLILAIALSSLIIPKTIFGQLLNLGSLENFAVFTGSGAVTNNGNSTYSGNIGTNDGIIDGFNAATVNGTIFNAGTITAQAKIDLLNVYIHLNNIAVTNTTHSPAFNAENVAPGVYEISSAGSLAGAITLNGGGNSKAVFIFKFEGELSATAGTTISLTNGANAANVFWISEGAISIGMSTTMKGTLISHPGSISFGANCSIEGRIFTTEGAITFGPGNAAIPTSLSTILISCNSICDNPILGSAANFSLFSSSGAVSNASSSSSFIGDIGSNVGSVTGFGSSLVVGTVYTTPNSTTAQAKIDLQSAYNQLITLPVTNNSHQAVFGGGEVVLPGVYSIASAGSVTGALTLDGGGNPNAMFVFKFNGALTVGAHSKVVLINDARRCNIYWVAEGAISMETFAFMKGNLIAHDDANNMATNGNLEGRMFSTLGAVGFSTGVAYLTYSLCDNSAPLPVKLAAFTAICTNNKIKLKWTTASELDLKNFVLQRSIDGVNWQIAGIVAGAGSASVAHSYIFSDVDAISGYNYFYRIKQNDFSGKTVYSEIISLKNCGKINAENFNLYPNPATKEVTLLYVGERNNIVSNEIYTAVGVRVFHSNGYQSKFIVSNLSAGVYYLNIRLKTKTITRKIVIVQ